MTVFRGLIIPDTRATLLAADTTITERGAAVDTPEKVSGENSLTLIATGTPSGEDTILTKATQSGARGSAGMSWQRDGDLLYRGFNPPNVPQGWRSLLWTDGSGSPFKATDPHALTLSSGKVLVTFEREVTGAREVVARQYNPDTDAWSSAVTVQSIADTAAVLRPCLLQLPSGRVLLFHFLPSGNIRMHFSANDGAAWAIGSRGILDDPIDNSGSPGPGAAGYALTRLRCVWSGDGIAIVAGLTANDTGASFREVFAQFSSVDLGASAQLVGAIWDGANNDDGGYHDLLALPGELALVYINHSRLRKPHIRRVGSIHEPLQGAEDVVVSPDVWGSAVDGDLAAWVEPDGRIVVAGRDIGGATQNIIARTATGPDYDGWSYLGNSATATDAGRIVATGSTNGYFRKLAACGAHGRGLLFHSWSAAAGNEDDSLAVLTLGGWSSVPLPSLNYSDDYDQSVGYSLHYYPIELPASLGWSTTGSGPQALAAGALALTAGGGTNRFYYKTDTEAVANGALLNVVFTQTAGGSASSAQIGARLRLADGSTEREVELRATAVKMVLFDVVAGTQVGSDMTSHRPDAGVDVLIALQGTSVKVWFRAAGSGPDAKYKAGPASASLSVDSSSAAANNRVQFGRIAASASAVDWISVGYLSGTHAGIGGERLTNSINLRGRSLPSYLADGITADQRGVAYTNDRWNIPLTADYALSRALPLAEPASPRVEWRSTAEAEAKIAIRLSFDKTETTDALGDTVGFGLFGVNFSGGSIEGYNGSAWVSLTSFNSAKDHDALDWVRKGDTVRPNGAASPVFMSHAHEWAGGYFKFSAGEGACRKILTNPGGVWDNSASARRVALSLEGTDGTEGSTGVAGAIWPGSFAVLVPLGGVDYSAFRIVIDASQGTAEGYYKIGQIVIGRVALLADEYAWGRTIDTIPGAEIVEGRDGKDRPEVFAPDRRVVEFGWSDGVDERAVEGDNPTPVYLSGSTASGALPLAAEGGTVRAAEGISRAIEGPRRALVYLPRVEVGATAVVLSRRDSLMLARVASPIRREVVVGDELENEVVRTAAVTLREVI